MKKSIKRYNIYKISQKNTSKGLPGIFADCLPDTFGQKVIDNYFLQNYGISSLEITPLMSLAYLHNRSIGALEYLPQFKDEQVHDEILSLAKLVDAVKKQFRVKQMPLPPRLCELVQVPAA